MKAGARSQDPGARSRPGSTSQNFVVVALGSNLGNSHQTVLTAMEALQEFSDTPLLRSSLWQTTPVDCPPGSPNFVNAVVGFTARPEETPDTLLPRLQAIEQTFGRTPKTIQNEPRALDLDLIAFGDETRSTPELTLPHPRAHQRRFVLQPLSEIAPDLVLPSQTKTVKQLLEELPVDPTVRRLSQNLKSEGRRESRNPNHPNNKAG